MGVAVYVMPLRTYLGGNFRTTWGDGGESDAGPRRRRSDEEVRRALDEFQDLLEKLLAFRPEWDEEGPIRSATIFSVDKFSAPFQLARQWAYRLNLPLLCALEPPQIWMPADFEPVIHLAPPWNAETKVSLASSARLCTELERLVDAIAVEERSDLAEAGQVAERLRGLAELGVGQRVPVIVEG